MNTIVDGIATNYILEGKGPAILFLHGWGDSHTTFEHLIKKLAKTHECIALDLPGFGGTQAPDSVWGIPEYSKFVQSFLKKIEKDARIIVAHSNGGTIAMYALAHDALEAKKLVLIGSAGIRDEDSAKKTAYKLVAKTGKMLTKIFPKNVQAKLKKKLYESAGSDIFVAPHIEATFKKVVGYDAQNDAKNIRAKTLLIYGSDDDATPVRYGRKLADALPHSELKIIESAGHFVHQENPDTVLGYMSEFLK